MREILFRGKAISADNDLDGKWIFGQLVVRPDNDDGIDKTFICESGHRFIRCLSKMPCTYEVDPETVGQFTGLTDKNGKRIFEGDIVSGDNYWHENRKKYQVAFEDSCFFLVDDGGSFWHKDHIENIEVIGNIHDNLELMSVEVEDGTA